MKSQENSSSSLHGVENQILVDEEKSKYLQTLEQAYYAIIVTNKKQIIEVFNDAAERLFGYSKEETVGKNLSVVYAHSQSLIFKYISSRKPSPFSINEYGNFACKRIMYKKSGTKFTAELSLSEINLQDGLRYILFIRDISEEIKVNELLAEERARNLRAQLLGQEEERNRIASDLHDGLQQPLIAAKFSVEALLSNPAMDNNLKPLIANIKKCLDITISENRRVISSIMPRSLEEHGLSRAIEELLEEIKVVKRIKTKLLGKKKFDQITKFQKFIYRIIQEAVCNTTKHSFATELSVSCKLSNGKHLIIIKDNGKGFDPSCTKSGFGTINMKQRAKSINGKLNIYSYPNHGVSVELEF